MDMHEIEVMGVEVPEHPEQQQKSMRKATDFADDYIQSLELRIAGEKHHISSPFCALDNELPAWLHEGHLIVVGGRPGTGKSIIGQQLADHVGESGLTSIFFSLEMSGYELIERSISRRASIPVSRLKMAVLETEDWDRLVPAIADIVGSSSLIDDNTYQIESIVKKSRAAAKHLVEQGLPKLGCIVVDYIQIIDTEKSFGTKALEVGHISKTLKRLAKELCVPVIALAQVNRDCEKRPNPRPTKSDLKDSGQVEQDADLIMLIYRDELHKEDSPDKGVAEILVVKNRHGPTGTTRLSFSGKNMKFMDLHE